MMKTLPLSLAFIALVAAAPLAHAAGASSSLSSKDESFLSEMPLADFPAADQVKAGVNSGTAIVDPFAPKAEPEKKVKQIYKGYTDSTLRRTIKDDRIDDGYAQGLLRRNGVQ